MISGCPEADGDPWRYMIAERSKGSSDDTLASLWFDCMACHA